MLVYQINAQGIYVGPVLADESPLEPGAWLIPAGCIETPPPETEVGYVAIWHSGAWMIMPDPLVGGGSVSPEMTEEQILEAARRGMRLSFAQLLIGLVTEQWITTAEGRAWRDRVALPTPVAELIATLPEEEQFAAETRAIAPSEVLRLDPLLVGLGAATGKTDAQIDAFFLTYGAV